MNAPQPPGPPPPPGGQPAGQPSAGPGRAPAGPSRQGAPPDPARELARARRAARNAQVLAAGAMVVAALAVVMSIAALAGGGSSGDEAAAPVVATPGSVQQSTAAATRTGTSGTGGDPGTTAPSSADTDRVPPEANFRLAYEGQRLTVQPPESCELRYVDVDEPRAGAARAFSEFSYGNSCGEAKAQIDILGDQEVPISAGGPNDNARDCAESIRNGPINEPLVPSQGMALCLVTSLRTARDEGISRKIVLIIVDAIRDDGTMTLSLTAWDVPR